MPEVGGGSIESLRDSRLLEVADPTAVRVWSRRTHRGNPNLPFKYDIILKTYNFFIFIVTTSHLVSIIYERERGET